MAPLVTVDETFLVHGGTTQQEQLDRSWAPGIGQVNLLSTRPIWRARLNEEGLLWPVGWRMLRSRLFRTISCDGFDGLTDGRTDLGDFFFNIPRGAP